ncbi:hypothetical protein [Streptomyces sp. 135]|uniref:hypothetical protein n=1 Tax=Streptomyces sp. 135 TaxID=2838850 RepID=UPI001CC0B6D4|nr:hypothetical protein [Streptomyces sp. 135]
MDALTRAGGAERDLGMRTLVDLLDRGISGLAEIPAAGAGPQEGGQGVRVAVAERPGELARLLAAVADLGVAAEDAAVETAAAGAGFTVRFGLPARTAEKVADALDAGGWTVVREDDERLLPMGEGQAVPGVPGV